LYKRFLSRLVLVKQKPGHFYFINLRQPIQNGLLEVVDEAKYWYSFPGFFVCNIGSYMSMGVSAHRWRACYG